MTVCLDPKNPNIIYCSRFTKNQETEIWKLNIETGTEEIILAQQNKSFSTPQLSPDGKWLLVTGSSITPQKVQNTDLFVIGTDGNNFTQLTYHPGNDLSGIWSPDGKSIYFISQRGAPDDKTYNVWKMDFNL
jgi:Tol biopolymer transport system component